MRVGSWGRVLTIKSVVEAEILVICQLKILFKFQPRRHCLSGGVVAIGFTALNWVQAQFSWRAQPHYLMPEELIGRQNLISGCILLFAFPRVTTFRITCEASCLTLYVACASILGNRNSLKPRSQPTPTTLSVQGQ